MISYITYPINTKNPGSLLPVILGYGLSTHNKIDLDILTDILGTSKKISDFDIAQWFSNKGTSLNYINAASMHVNIDELETKELFKKVEGEWLLCPCGKVEILDIDVITSSNAKLNMVTPDNRCILCKGELNVVKGVGLVVHLDDLKLQDTVIEKNAVFPPTTLKEINTWTSAFVKNPMLVSRRRNTPYKIKVDNEIFNLDPTFYNIYITWYYCLKNKRNPVIVSGRDGIPAYALGRLLFKKNVQHIFLPRFKISDWRFLLGLTPDQLFFLIAGSLNWKTNNVAVEKRNLKFINSHLPELKQKISKIKLNSMENIKLINNNLYNL